MENFDLDIQINKIKKNDDIRDAFRSKKENTPKENNHQMTTTTIASNCTDCPSQMCTAFCTVWHCK